MGERIKTCYEVTSRVSERLTSEYPDTKHYVLGGIATGAIADYEEVDVDVGAIYPTRESDLSVVRKNGTTRDIDVLVLNQDKGVVADMASLAVETAAADMKVDVFGLDGYSMQRGLLQDAFKFWTSRRQVDEDGSIRHVLLPFSARIPDSAFEPWEVRPRDMHPISVTEPYYHLLSYDLRSIGGPRPKDQEKLQSVREHAFELTRDHGTGMDAYSDLEDMKALLQTLRDQSISEARTNDQLVLLLKSRLSAWAEDQKWVVDFFQKPVIQSMVRPFVGSQKKKR